MLPQSPARHRSSINRHEQLTALCKASGDALRLKILRVLQQNSYAVQELCEIFAVKQSAMSHHLKLLSQAGLVDSKREGNTLFYRRQPVLAQADFQAFYNGLFAALDTLEIAKKEQQVLDIISHRRSKRSLQFFNEHADQLKTQQDLIAEYPQYGDTVASLLNSLPGQQRRLALEVGPGEGQFLPELCQRFEQVLALDNSATMLKKAQQFMAPLNFGNLQWLHGDTTHPELKQLGADLIVLNMVLHHTSSPASIFQDLALAMAPGGTLIITDLCRHDQDWAQQNCGDLWLGFDTEELVDWAQQAGLHSQQTLYLSLLNGFRIQICVFTSHYPANAGIAN